MDRTMRDVLARLEKLEDIVSVLVDDRENMARGGPLRAGGVASTTELDDIIDDMGGVAHDMFVGPVGHFPLEVSHTGNNWYRVIDQYGVAIHDGSLRKDAAEAMVAANG